MADDLVKRLRAGTGDGLRAHDWMNEAADRIEKLEALVEQLRDDNSSLIDSFDKDFLRQESRIETLEAALLAKTPQTNKGESMMDTVTINGVEYAPVKTQTGTRAVIVVDRGWIFAGDVTRQNGRIKLANALHVFKWERIGFAGMIADTKEAKADLRKIADVDIPAGAEVFCVPVPDGWGL